VRQFQFGPQGRHDHQGRARGVGATGVRIVLAGGREKRVQPVAEAGDASVPVFQEEPKDPGTHVQAAPPASVLRLPQKVELDQLL